MIPNIPNQKLLFTVVLLFNFNIFSLAQEYKLPKESIRIVFLGNSITYQGAFINYIDTYLRLRYPDRTYEIINLGLPSETLSGLSETGHAEGKFPRPDLRERLQRVLIQLNPELIFANYGMNDGIYLPFDEHRFDQFKMGMNWMHETIENSGAKLIHVTPPIYDERKGAAYANVLDIYSDWLLSFRYTHEWQVIDLHWPMRKELEDQRKLDSEFAFAKDGIHPNESGHFLMAKIILIGLGENINDTKTIEDLLAPFPNGIQVLTLIEQRQEILKLAWLSATGHQRPGIPEGFSLETAEEKVAEINREIQAILEM